MIVPSDVPVVGGNPLTCRFLACFVCDGNLYENSSHAYEKDFSVTLSRTNSVADNHNMVEIPDYDIDLSNFRLVGGRA